MVPILGLIESQLNAPKDQEISEKPKSVPASSVQENHHPALLALLAEELSVAPDEIRDFEL